MAISETHRRSRFKFGPALALTLWTAPLVFPTAGFAYIAVKIIDGEAFGPYSILLSVVCIVWYAATLVPLCIVRYRRAIASRPLKLLMLYVSIGIAVLMAELMMTALDVVVGLSPCRPATPSWWCFAPEHPKLANDFVSDSLRGARYVRPDDPNFNRQGFRDRDDFTAKSIRDWRSLRVLLIGDSFAFGHAAINDGSNSGFADLLEQRLNRRERFGAVVWNTGIPGTGQREQMLHLKTYLPILKPRIVLLAFYEGNDLDDNSAPIARYYVFEDGTWADRYLSDGTSHSLLSPRQAWLRSQGFGIERKSVFLTLRTTSTAWRLFARVKDRLDGDERSRPSAEQIAATSDVLREISSRCGRHNAALKAVVVPEMSTMTHAGDATRYEAILRMFQDLSIDCLDMRPHLTIDDYAPAPDFHWTSSGHRKAADAIADFLRE